MPVVPAGIQVQAFHSPSGETTKKDNVELDSTGSFIPLAGKQPL